MNKFYSYKFINYEISLDDNIINLTESINYFYSKSSKPLYFFIVLFFNLDDK